MFEIQPRTRQMPFGLPVMDDFDLKKNIPLFPNSWIESEILVVRFGA